MKPTGKFKPKKRGRGRPSLLTPEREARLMGAIEKGMPLKQAAMLAGMSYETLNRWRLQGEAEDAALEFRHFWQALRKAQAVAMERLLSRIDTASLSDWKAAAWLLERRHPEEFAKPQKLEHSGPGGAAIVTANLGANEGRNYISDKSLLSLVRPLVQAADSEGEEHE